MNIVGIIPARFASSRLMGKPLADIGGKPMIWHTYNRAKKSKLINEVIIAVDDSKVFSVCKNFGANVIMTPKEMKTGSDRIARVTEELPSAEIIVNVQGDEPFINPTMIDEAIEPLLFDKTVNVSTLAKKIISVEELQSKSIPKVVFDYDGNALYFSRSPIPFVRDARNNLERIASADIYKHIGLYVYRRDALLKFASLEPTILEKAEKLEQLRMIENGMKIKIVPTEFESFSVDTPKDLQTAREIYKKLNKKKSTKKKKE